MFIDQISRKYIKLFASCKIVWGAKNGLITDLQRSKYYQLEMDSIKFISGLDGVAVSDLVAEHSENLEIVNDYLSFLLDEEIIFFTDTPELFLPLSDKWNEPHEATNAIVDIDTVMPFHFKGIKQLSEIGCPHIQFRFFSLNPLQDILLVLDNCRETNFKSIELAFNFHVSISDEFLDTLVREFKSVSYILVFNSNVERYIHRSPNNFGNIYFISGHPLTDKLCGQIDTSSFIINTKFFTESKSHNTCLNRKVSIDRFGFIKNCPSMMKDYGHIDDTTILNTLKTKEFTDIWAIDKDQVQTCRDCEFRHICTDCRAFLEEPSDLLSKPLKCGYNPYTSVWEDWSISPLKQKAKLHYGITAMQ